MRRRSNRFPCLSPAHVRRRGGQQTRITPPPSAESSGRRLEGAGGRCDAAQLTTRRSLVASRTAPADLLVKKATNGPLVAVARCCGPQGLALTWSRGSASDECASRRSRFELSEAVRAKRDGLGLSFGLPTPRCRRGAATCVRTQILPSSAPANRVHGLQVLHVAWPPRRDGASAPRPSYLYSSGDSPAHGRSRRRNTSPRQDVRVGPTRHIPQSPTRASRCRGSPCPARQPGIRGSTAFFPHCAVMGRDCCGWGRGERSGPAPPAERPPHATATDLACMLLGFVSGRGCLSQQYEQGRKQHSVADRRPG